MLDKKETRAKYKLIRTGVTGREYKEKLIADRLFKRFGGARSVFCYQSFGSEVSTKEIIAEFLRRGAKVFVPDVCGDAMLLKNIETGEPADKPCKLTVVPLLAYDGGCYRIGYGKGYYDRYLANNNTTSVGIAFSEQYCAELPKDAHDVPLSCIITPDIIYEMRVK